ncbi:MAG: hypothetical protein WCT77_00310 [Bacteroidota bacterium]|jgi:hypothetical protein
MDEVIGIFKDCILRESERTNSDWDDIHVIINSREGFDPYYSILNLKTQSKKDVTFNYILGVKIDLLLRELFAVPFIKSALKNLCEENNLSFENIKIRVYTPLKKDGGVEFKKNVYPILFNNENPIRQLKWNEVIIL